MNACEIACDDPVCKEVGCLEQPAHHFRGLLKQSIISKKSLVTISSQTTEDPNQFGEMLREYAFKEKTGCYSCFDLISEFHPINKDTPLGIKLLKALDWLPEEERFKDISAEHYVSEPDYDGIFNNAHLYTNNVMHIAWFWDGDGHLIISEGERAAENTDCKKTNGWSWINW